MTCRSGQEFAPWNPYPLGRLSGRQSCQQGASGQRGVLLSGRVRGEEQGWSFEGGFASELGEGRGGQGAPEEG